MSQTTKIGTTSRPATGKSTLGSGSGTKTTSKDEVEKFLKARKEARLRQALKMQNNINLKLHEKDQKMAETLAMGIKLLDREVEKHRRYTGWNPFGRFFEEEGHMLLLVFTIFVLVAGMLTFPHVLMPAKQKTNSYRKIQSLIRLAYNNEDINGTYTHCNDADVSPWKLLVNKEIAQVISKNAKANDGNPSPYIYWRTVIVERESNEKFPTVDQCPPSIILRLTPFST